MDDPLDRLQKKLAEQYSEMGSWERVGEHYGVHRVVVWRIVNDDYEPMANDVRRKLGLPEIIQRRAYRDKKSGRFAKSPTGK